MDVGVIAERVQDDVYSALCRQERPVEVLLLERGPRRGF
jgi:hypothetical protein